MARQLNRVSDWLSTIFAKIASNKERVDYYALLSIDRDATQEEITKAWRRLVLQHHPDKQLSSASPSTPIEDGVDIRLVNEAKWILSDPSRRREWEDAFFDGKLYLPVAMFRAYEAGKGEAIAPRDNTPHISHHISLELFTPHYGSPAVNSPEEDEVDPSWYSHECRCSGEFVITLQDLEEGVEVVGCGGCGEWVRVGYEAIEEEDISRESG